MNLKNLASVGAVGGAGAMLMNQHQETNKSSYEESEITDGTESADDFFDAEDTASIPRSVHVAPSNNNNKQETLNESTEIGNNVNSSSTDEETEFVMIDHPQQAQQQQKLAVPQTINEDSNTIMDKGEIGEEKGDSVANLKYEEEKPLLTENDQTKPDIAEITRDPVLDNKDKVVKVSSPFDAIFGVTDNHQTEEDEPIMVSSFTESEVSDPFTVSTNSSTHRVAPPPPPPQSRQSRSASINNNNTSNSNAVPVVAKQLTKKPPAPPPQNQQQKQFKENDQSRPTSLTTNTTPLVSNDDFDAIFGTPTFESATTKTTANVEKDQASLGNEGFETNFTTNNANPQVNTSVTEQGGFDSVFAVTPSAEEKAVPSVSSPFEVTTTKDQASLANNQNENFTPQQQKEVTQHVYSPNSSETADNDNNNDVNTIEEVSSKGENQGVHRGVADNKEEEKLKSYTSSNLNNTTTTTTASETQKKGDEDDKKKKKKKGIVSWAKHFGGKKKEKTKSEGNSSKTSSSAASSSKPVAVEDSQRQTNPTTSVHSSHSNNLDDSIGNVSSNNAHGYDLDTIQGSHIAELVNMGFEPAQALEALDRYDQDVEKATNYLLDQAYR